MIGSKTQWLRIIGLLLLFFLLWRIDFPQMLAMIRQSNVYLIMAAVTINLPLVFLKAVRWRQLLRSQGILYGALPATLSYFGSIFIGFLTPGRLGEFVKAAHLSKDCSVPLPRAFSSVLVDRLFDLVVLLACGSAALLSLPMGHSVAGMFGLFLACALVTLPVALFLNPRTFQWLNRLVLKFGKLRSLLHGEQSWVVQIHNSLREFSLMPLLVAAGITLISYCLFFGGCYLLAAALGLNVTLIQTIYAVSLGSLVTLIPISIAGLGTRDAAILAFFGAAGISKEASIGFSLSIFFVFNICCGLMGAAAWLIKPVHLDRSGGS